MRDIFHPNVDQYTGESVLNYIRRVIHSSETREQWAHAMLWAGRRSVWMLPSHRKEISKAVWDKGREFDQ